MVSCDIPEIAAGAKVAVDMVFQYLVDNEILKQCAFGKVSVEIVYMTQVEQCAGKSGVVKIELGRLDDAFVEIAVVRSQQVNDVTGL